MRRLKESISKSESEAASETEELKSLMTSYLSSFPAVIIGRVSAVVRGIGPLVSFPGNTPGELTVARSIVPVYEKDIESDVALAFEDRDITRPLILGIIQNSEERQSETFKGSAAAEVTIDEDILVLSAKKQIVLRCGKSSITLTKDGKLVIEGEYVLSESSGVNRIRGGSVQIN